MGKWTHFMDMHSGGGTKLAPFEHIYIEAPEPEARAVFYNKFGRNPDRVTCTCCGPDYSVSEFPSLAQATAYERNCEWDKSGNGYVEKQRSTLVRIRAECRTSNDDPWGLYLTLNQFLKRRADVKVIRAKEIKKAERQADIPASGYVWVD